MTRCKQTAWLLILFIFISLTVCPSVWAEAKKTVGIVEFENNTNVQGLGSFVLDMLVVELPKNPKFTVVERIKLDQVLKEQWIGAHQGMVNQKTAARTGKLNGVDYLIIGSVTNAQVEYINNLFSIKQRGKVTVTYRLVDANTGIIYLAGMTEGEASKSVTAGYGYGRSDYSYQLLTDAAQKAALELTKRIHQLTAQPPLEGYVAQLTGRQVYIDLGQKHNVQAGQVFRVYREGNAVYHPVTGALLGLEKNNIATIQVESVDTNMSRCVIKAGGAIEVGDKVKSEW